MHALFFCNAQVLGEGQLGVVHAEACMRLPCNLRSVQVLGKGNFGVVHLVYEKKTNKPFACKSISKRKLVTADDIEDVRREVQILLHLAGHKNVVQMYGAYEDKSYIHLVMVSVVAVNGHPGLAWWKVDGLAA